MKQKRRFFKKTKAQEETVKEKEVVKKLQQGRIAFKEIKQVAKKSKEALKKRPHFPKINRIIPDPTSLKLRGASSWKDYSRLKWIFLCLLILLGLAWNIWVGMLFFKSFSSWSQLLFQREKLTEQMTLWENIAKQYPSFRDAYVKGEIYAYMLGDKAKEQYFLQNLELLDPNFPITKSFEQLNKLQNE